MATMKPMNMPRRASAIRDEKVTKAFAEVFLQVEGGETRRGGTEGAVKPPRQRPRTARREAIWDEGAMPPRSCRRGWPRQRRG